jgi:peptidoglycan/LPS O-acetylase OafA/YrhL
MQADRLLPLDGLRAVAILAVILLHAGIWRGGGVGVDLFFVLSGFLITGILLDAKASASSWQAYLWPFYVRRALRIFPVAFAALGLVFLLAPALELWPAPPFREQVWFWTYLSNWYAGPRSYAGTHLQHFWSLAVEEQFYFIWPLVAWRCSRSTVKRISGACVIVIPLLRLLATVWHIPASPTVAALAPTVFRFDGLAAGAWLALVAREPGGLHRWRHMAWWTLPIGVIAIRLTGDVGGAVLIFAAALVAALTCDSRHLYARILTLPSLRWIGRVSYVVYVVHYPIAARLLGGGVSPLETLAITLTVSLLVAWASWRWFEQPILAARTRWPMPAAIRPVEVRQALAV